MRIFNNDGLNRNWTILAAIDFDRWAAETYRVNFPGVDVKCAKVEDVIADLPKCDVLVAGPPCQPYSTAGNGAGADDERDGIPTFCQAVELLKPRHFIMENVKGMMRQKFIGVMQGVFNRLNAVGYVVDIKLLNAVNFGVPQQRERYFWWGIRRDLYDDGMRHAWPEPTHTWPPPEAGLFGRNGHLLPAVTVRQALGLNGSHVFGGGRNHTKKNPDGTWQRDERNISNEPSTTIPCSGFALKGGQIPRIHEYGSKLVVVPPRQNGCPPTHSIDEPSRTIGASRADEWKIAHVKHDPKHPIQQLDKPANTLGSGGGGNSPTGNSTALAIDTKQNRTRQHVDSPSPTLAGDSRHHIKNGSLYIRRLTPLECARLQSCPDDMLWPDGITKTAQYKIVGNGWACGVAARLSQAVKSTDPASRTVIDLYAGGGLGALGWHGRFWSYKSDGNVQNTS